MQALERRPWRCTAYWPAQPTFLYSPGWPAPSYSRLGPSTSLMGQQNLPEISTEVPSSQRPQSVSRWGEEKRLTRTSTFKSVATGPGSSGAHL